MHDTYLRLPLLNCSRPDTGVFENFIVNIHVDCLHILTQQSKMERMLCFTIQQNNSLDKSCS